MKKEFFVHDLGCCESEKIGRDTRIWAYTHILPDAVIGEDCNICDHVFVENDVVIGDRVTIKCGVQVWDGVTLGDDVFVGPNATFTNDSAPRSKQYPEEYEKTLVCANASIGANATILCGLTIGQNSMVGAGAVVTHSVPTNAIVTGNPARIVGYVDTMIEEPREVVGNDNKISSGKDSGTTGVSLIGLPVIEDLRGVLSVGEVNKQIPFVVNRYFIVYGVSNKHVRGEHAHKECHQFLVCINGSVSVMVDDGESRQEFVLNSPSIGLHIEPMVWGVQYKYSSDAILLVFASELYDPDDYIRDYQQFLDQKKS